MIEWMPKTLKGLIVRVYTLAIMLVVLFTGYMAVSYLYRSIFRPGTPPVEMLEWQAVTEADRLRDPTARGITEPAGRAPLAHYHAVDRWMQPDLRAGCLTSGCHDPIPHKRSKELRAFANLHSTFMSCEVCHTTPSATPMPSVWADLRTGRAQPPPAILQLSNRVYAATQPADLAGEHADILRLLRQAIAVVGSDPVLDHLALRLDTARPDSPVWRRAVEQLRMELPNHARGDYGAKITPSSSGADPQPIVSDYARLADEYFAKRTDAARRTAIHTQIHQPLVLEPEACVACHRATPPMLDFAALGYSDQRIREFTSTPVVGMMQQIRAGQPFGLPLGR